MANKKFALDYKLGQDNLKFTVRDKNFKSYPNFHKFEKSISVKINHNILAEHLDIVEIQLELKKIFKDIIVNLTENVDKEDFVAFEISNEIMENPIFIKPIKLESFKIEKIFDEFYKYVQSFREFLTKKSFDFSIFVTKYISGGSNKFKAPCLIENLNKNKKSVIEVKNKDNSCAFRALFIAKYYQDNKNNLDKKQWKIIRYNYYNIQYKEGLKLAEKFGLDFNKPVGPKEWQIIQNGLQDYQIRIINSNINLRANQFIFVGPKKPKFIYIQYLNKHYNAITNIQGFMGYNYFCEKCFKGFSNYLYHRCRDKCQLCFAYCEKVPENKVKCHTCLVTYNNNVCYNEHKKIICRNSSVCKNCDKIIYKGKIHECVDEVFCHRCKTLDKNQPHSCYIQKLEQNKINQEDKVNKIIVAFDIESIIKEGEHIPNLLIYKTICDKCIAGSDCELGHNTDSNILFGLDCIEKFIDYLFIKLPVIAEKNRALIYVFAHNFRGYDGQFLLREIWSRKFNNPKIIMRGRKILKIEIGNVRLLDSLNFFLQPLEKLPRALGLDAELVKGLFPFHFNKEENYNYIGEIPHKSMFGYDFMSKNKQKKFDEWHESFLESKLLWNFKDELIKYCKNDVEILLKCVMKFRNEFIKITGIDPITRCFTLASVGLEVFRTKFLQNNQLAKSPNNNYSDSFSKNSIKGNSWLDYLKKYYNIEFKREYKLFQYYIDGFDAKNRTAYEFLGCKWHGHDCLKESDKDKFNDWLRKKEYLENKGFKVNFIWECEYNILKRDEKFKYYLREREKYYAFMNKDGWLDIRNSFFGGRTDNERYYYEAKPNEQIRIVDFCSQYPFVLKNCYFPIGIPISIKQNFDFSLKSYFGFIKCKIIPPQNLRIPILPTKIIQMERIGEKENKIGEKLIFPLCKNCAAYKIKECKCKDRSLVGTWTTIEVQKAIDFGYELKEIYEVLHYDSKNRSKDLFKEYINMWLKIKQEASGWPSWCQNENDKQKYIEDYEKIENIKLDYDKIIKNDALRYIAKIMLNSFWGKLAQKPNQTKQEFYNSYHQYFNLLNDESKEIESEMMLNDTTLLAIWKFKDNESDAYTNFNIAVASYVTAWARLKLFEKLIERDTIRPHSILYYDTDSIYFIEKECDPKIEIGSFLGDLTDEVTDKYGEGAKCIKFVSLGAKNYAYVIEKSNGEIKTEYKCKGISLTSKAHEIINFENIVKQAIKRQSEESSAPLLVPQLRFKINKYHEIYSEYFDKIYRATGDKRNVLLKNNVYVTVPWGYK